MPFLKLVTCQGIGSDKKVAAYLTVILDFIVNLYPIVMSNFCSLGCANCK
jgi:hypothetical protein